PSTTLFRSEAGAVEIAEHGGRARRLHREIVMRAAPKLGVACVARGARFGADVVRLGGASIRARRAVAPARIGAAPGGEHRERRRRRRSSRDARSHRRITLYSMPPLPAGVRAASLAGGGS